MCIRDSDWYLAVFFDNNKLYLLFKLAKNQFGSVYNPATKTFIQKGAKQRTVDILDLANDMFNVIYVKLLEILNYDETNNNVQYSFSENKLTFEVLQSCYISDEKFPRKLSNLACSFIPK